MMIPAGTEFYEASGTACYGKELTIYEEKKVGDTIRLLDDNWVIAGISITKNGKIRIKIHTWDDNGNSYKNPELLKREYLSCQ